MFIPPVLREEVRRLYEINAPFAGEALGALAEELGVALGLKLIGAIAGEYRAVAGVEERAVLEQGDGVGCGVEGGGEG
ncbi:hypothetical protein V500_10066, partial [Pseudogymnoascus sp. VKM F-4518 (FW-2643)]